MKVRFNLDKEARKNLVKAVSEITGEEAAYQGAPSFAFSIGGYTVDRHGTLSCDGQPEAFPLLLDGLAARGYVHGSEDGSEEAPKIPEPETPARLSIEVPLSGFTPADIANVLNLVAAKAWAFQKMAGTEGLPVERLDDRLSFPWFAPDSTAVELDAYSHLIARICETAKTKKRVAATEHPPEPGDNEKFKARCALLSLGFIGAEYAQARKILLAPFSGNGSHKTGDGKKSREAAD
jgi:hypothetical protein